MPIPRTTLSLGMIVNWPWYVTWQLFQGAAGAAPERKFAVTERPIEILEWKMNFGRMNWQKCKLTDFQGCVRHAWGPPGNAQWAPGVQSLASRSLR